MKQFCCQETQRFDEPIAGSAMQVKRYIFVGWPRGGWAFDPMVPKNAPDGLSKFTSELRQTKAASLRLFNKPLADGTTDIIFCPEMRRINGVPVDKLTESIKAYLRGEAVPYPSEQLPGTHLFICTHGIRDKCCAKFGFGAVRALKDAFAQGFATTHQFSIWETSHLIGDRFAGTAIQFPEGHMYGWMSGENICEMVKVLDEQRVYYPGYRGNVFMDDQKQTCEATGQQFLYEQGLVGEVNVIEKGGNEFTVAVCVGDARYEANLRLEQREYLFYSNCTHLSEDRVSTKMRWVHEPAEFKPLSISE